MKTGLVAILVWLTVIAAVAYGWMSNIITIVNSDFTVMTGELIVRLFGIVIVPLGAIMGYIG